MMSGPGTGKGLLNSKLRVDMGNHSHHIELVADKCSDDIADTQSHKRAGVSARFLSAVTDPNFSTCGRRVKNSAGPAQFG